MLSAIFFAAVSAEGSPPPLIADGAEVKTTVGKGGTSLVVEATGVLPDVPAFYTAEVSSEAWVKDDEMKFSYRLKVKTLQGEPEVFRFRLAGKGEVLEVKGGAGWSVRQEGQTRYLDLTPQGEAEEQEFEITAKWDDFEVPSEFSLLRIERGEAVGLSNTITVFAEHRISLKPSDLRGYELLDDGVKAPFSFVATKASGALHFFIERSGGPLPVAEMTTAKLVGSVNEEGGYVDFVLSGEVEVYEEDSELEILRGQVAMQDFPDFSEYRLILSETRQGSPSYRLKFAEAGKYRVELKFTTRLDKQAEWTLFDFHLNSGAVIPLSLRGVAGESEFQKRAAVVPVQDGSGWLGYVPLSGTCAVAWKSKRKAGEGKLFFNTEALVDVGVGAGLMRQSTEIGYKILQGQLDRLVIGVEGAGEILAVAGANVLSWSVEEKEGERRVLNVILSRPIESHSSLRVQSQLALDAFPVRAAPLRLTPQGAVRHSGYVRVSNIGATRLEVVDAKGLTQLAPEQFPGKGKAAGSRQNFVYRFPAAAHSYEVLANRVQPEVSVSQMLLYRLSETDRIIEANVELDIREAPLREWDLMIPGDYSVVSVAGAEVGDYVVGSQVEAGARTLKVIFNKEVAGRQLVSVQLEKNEAAATGEWALPRLQYPEAKSVRGQLGVSSVPGFRIAAGEVSELVEIALSRFPENRAGLQQAFRIREREWSAVMTVEKLPQSVQADAFHLYTLQDQRAFASVVMNYFITGAPVSEWELAIPAAAQNVEVDGQDVRTWRIDKEQNLLQVELHQPVIGPYLLLVTYEVAIGSSGGGLPLGEVAPVGVDGERGYVQVVSPLQVDAKVKKSSPSLLKLDPMELPAEFRLFSAEPALATYQYTARPFELAMNVRWYEPGETIAQVVEFSEAESKVSRDGQVRTEVFYLVKSRGSRVLRVTLPQGAKLWETIVAGERVSARQDGSDTLIPLPAGANANELIQVKLRMAKPTESSVHAVVTLPVVNAPILRTKWSVTGESGRTLVPKAGNLSLSYPVLKETGFEWVANYGLVMTGLVGFLLCLALWLRKAGDGKGWQGWSAILLLALVFFILLGLAQGAWSVSYTHLTLPTIYSV